MGAARRVATVGARHDGEPEKSQLYGEGAAQIIQGRAKTDVDREEEYPQHDQGK